MTLDLIAPSDKKAILFHSGPMDGSGLAGVGIIMTPKIASGLLDYEAVSDRIVMARLKGQSNNLTILSVYAPIRDAPDHLKDKFYADLQLTMNKIPRKDILVIGGDDSEWAIGNHGLGDRDSPGSLVCWWCCRIAWDKLLSIGRARFLGIIFRCGQRWKEANADSVASKDGPGAGKVSSVMDNVGLVEGNVNPGAAKAGSVAGKVGPEVDMVGTRAGKVGPGAGKIGPGAGKVGPGTGKVGPGAGKTFAEIALFSAGPFVEGARGLVKSFFTFMKLMRRLKRLEPKAV
ncbi:hypothetical protein QYM36_002221 [Artemia franciscana]|uniref:Uncharacterized protein n=1 Tax=Artemia franciscana TaxID=6661 RepID=A0AA88ILA2_ARTSF|nr:hypothetical protein QYM36_002221 [Artemia franciscana]